VRPEQLAALVSLIEAGKISGSAGKQVLDAMFRSGKDADTVVAELGLGRIEDSSIVAEAIAKVVAANEKAVADYRAGKTEAVKFLVGQVMRETRGRANAAEVQTLLQAELDRAS
jgi:aspartyl-tRNA(Asn)/glutamyl-tRNA(Gln) amidotransferase subunit B